MTGKHEAFETIPPTLVGYKVKWDRKAGEWVATREDDPKTVLRGKDQAALELARWQLVMRLCDELRAITNYALANGYTPPPRSP